MGGGVILLLALSVSCRKQITEEVALPVPNDPGTMVATKLGELKPNIYSLGSVQKALNGVLADKARITNNGVMQQSTLNPTHYYIRFAPQNMEQLVRLEEADFVLYDVPLDADIQLEGDFYQDPAIPADQITYQYTLVPDMVYGYGGTDGNTTLTSRALQNGVYRSAGRALHYYALFKTISPTSGTASNYWWTVQKQMFANWVSNNAPPFGTKTSQNAGAIAVIESFAYYYGNMRNSERYQTGAFGFAGGAILGNAERDQIENQRVNSNIAITVLGSGLNTWYEGWIPCGLLHDVGDIGENTAFTGITDAADAYNSTKIYYAIKNAAHADVNSFVTTLLNTGFSAQQTQIRSLQTQYGY